MDKAEYGAENLGVCQITLCRQGVKHCRLHKMSIPMSRNARISAIKQNLRALLFTFCNQRLDSVLALAANYRSHLHTFIKPITYAQGGRCRGDRITKRLLR